MFKPDFLIIPYCIKANPNLRPSDGDVYAAIYWFERLKDGRCTAGNEAIADVACCGIRNVRGALERLESEGAIIRIWKDPDVKNIRSEIKTLIHYGRPVTAPTPGLPGVPERTDTPGEIARQFFQHEEGERNHMVDEVISNLVEKTNAPREVIQNEVQKFRLYWTEPNKSGTKQRWQTEKTFEVQRRLYTWLSRAGTINKTAARSGAGRTI